MGKERIILTGAALLFGAGSFLAGQSTNSNTEVEKVEVQKPSILVIDPITCGANQDIPPEFYTINPSEIDESQHLITGTNNQPMVYIYYDKDRNLYQIFCGSEFTIENTDSGTNT